jgi:Skp family chaperone for outer membrane proteins
VAERVKAEHYDIVFDRTSPMTSGFPIVLYAKEAYDFTNEVVTALNKSKGTASTRKPK